MGNASHPKATMKVILVQLSWDGSGWHDASGTSNWSCVLRTIGLSNGPHNLRARAYDGAKYSKEATVRFVVHNKAAGPVWTTPDLFCLAAIVIAVVAMLATIAIVRRRIADNSDDVFQEDGVGELEDHNR
jgi:hypothetical protein